jgi:hypothetical protein
MIIKYESWSGLDTWHVWGEAYKGLSLEIVEEMSWI